MSKRLTTGNTRKQPSPGNINLSFGRKKRVHNRMKHESLLTFVENARKLQYKPAPSTLSFMKTILSLFL